VNFNNIYSDIVQFCLKISVDKSLIGRIDEFEAALIKVLSNSNIDKTKKYINSKGNTTNQTHFDITGKKNMSFFFDMEKIKKYEKEDKKIDKSITIEIINNNYDFIENIDVPIQITKEKAKGQIYRYTVRKEFDAFIKQSNSMIHSSKSLVKLGHKPEEPQVQINKLDNKDIFYKMRKCFYEDDRVVFLKYRKYLDRYLCIIIPGSIIHEFKNLEYYKRGNNIIINTIKDSQTNSTSSVGELNNSEVELENGDQFGVSLKDIEISNFTGIESISKSRKNNNLDKESSKNKRKSSDPIKGRDYLAEHARKEEIGKFGEALTMLKEKQRLKDSENDELIKKSEEVEWSSKEIGDGLGYDIKSYDISDNGDIIDKFIEVKTTLGSDKAFEITAKEVNKSKELSKIGKYVIVRVYNVNLKNMMYEYYFEEGPITNNYELYPTEFLAFKK